MSIRNGLPLVAAPSPAAWPAQVTRQTFPDSTFTVPARLTKQSSPLSGRGRGQQ